MDTQVSQKEAAVPHGDIQTTASAPPKGRYRWTICSMLVFATTVNYMDRQLLGLLAPMLQKDIGWTQMEYSWLVNAFTIAYGAGTLICGRIIDKLGTKISYAVAMVVWSAAVNLGVVVSPALIPFIAIHYGWHGAFLILGAVGFVWLIPWFFLFGKPQDKASAEELAWIRQDKEEHVSVESIKWTHLLRYRQLWAFALGKMLTDPIWWFFLFWLPKWLNETRDINMAGLGVPLIMIYLFAIGGSLGAGWLPGKLMSMGFSAAKARKTTMLICACAVIPIFAATQVESLWLAVALVGLAAAAHQGWSANLLTSVSDLFPNAAVG
ncbi:MFS transporter [Symbiopectobacterium sp. Eva_TO]